MYRPSLGTRGEARRAQIEAETALLGRVRPWTRVPNQPCPLAPHVFVPRWIRAPDPPTSPLKAAANAHAAQEALHVASELNAFPPPAFDDRGSEGNADASLTKDSPDVDRAAPSSTGDVVNADAGKTSGPDGNLSKPTANGGLQAEGSPGLGPDSLPAEAQTNKISDALNSRVVPDLKHENEKMQVEDEGKTEKDDVLMREVSGSLKAEADSDALKTVPAAADPTTAVVSTLDFVAAPEQSPKGGIPTAEEQSGTLEGDATSHLPDTEQPVTGLVNPATSAKAEVMASESLQSGPSPAVGESEDPSAVNVLADDTLPESGAGASKDIRLTETAAAKAPASDAVEEQVDPDPPGRDCAQASTEVMMSEGAVAEDCAMDVDSSLAVEGALPNLGGSEYNAVAEGSSAILGSKGDEDLKRGENE